MFGLNERDIQQIIDILSAYPEVETGLIYGSRAKGIEKPGSDVDIALKGKGISHSIIRDIAEKLNEETLMPYHFDIVNYHTVENKELILHIDRVGVEFYSR